MQNAQERSDHSLLISLCLVLMTLVVFGQIRYYDFLILDDYAYIVENPHVRSGLSVENVLWAFTSYWHPLTWLSHMLDCEIYGLNPPGHHVHALLLHAANALLLFLVLRNMTGALWRSAFVAAVFALHPLRIESVAWVAERKDVLAAFFWMTTLWAYLKFTRKPSAANYILTIFIFAFGLMAKPTLVTLPFVVILLDYWPLGRFRFGLYNTIHSADSGGNIRSPAMIILEKVPLLLLAAGSSLVTFLAVKMAGGINPDAVPLALRAENALISYVKYLGEMIWPTDLAVLYPHSPDPLSFWSVAGSLFLLGCVSFVVFLQATRQPYLVVGWLWYLGTLVPVIGLVQVGAQTMADRFTYVPHVGLSIAAVWGVSDLTSRWPRRNILLAVISGLILCSLALSTHRQLPYWKDSISLLSRAIQVTRNNFLAHHFLGNALSREHRLPEAIHQFSEALKINPRHLPSLYNLAFIMAQEGMLEEATDHYNRALQLSPNDATIYNNLGNLLARQGKSGEAIRHYSKALEIKPDYAPAHNNLGNLFMEEGKTEQAIIHYSAALRIEPGLSEARHNLKLAMERMRQKESEGTDESCSLIIILIQKSWSA
jgi:tetratricopeptide (TPR) repeat protein